MNSQFKTTEKCYAKINLTLDVTSKREDGYHNVKMIMQTVSLHDKVIVSRQRGFSGVRVRSNLKYLPSDERNIAYKAAANFLDSAGITGEGIEIELFKRIPVGAGLAGGSTDAAGVLRALERLYKTNYTPEELSQMGAKIGADVPYCIKGGTVLCEGIGEILTPLKPLQNHHVLLCKPKYGVSTAKIYSMLKVDEISKHPDTQGALDAIKAGNHGALWSRLYNVLEEVVSEESHGMLNIKSIMLENGAKNAVMSGSGPTVFGIFEDMEDMRTAYKELQKKYEFVYQSEMVNPDYFE